MEQLNKMNGSCGEPSFSLLELTVTNKQEEIRLIHVAMD